MLLELDFASPTAALLFVELLIKIQFKKKTAALWRFMFDQVNFFPLRQDTVLNDYDEEEHFIRVNTDGKTAKFKLTKKDWELMEIKEYPSGGRLLGGAWTTIFRRGVKQSNEWCNLRLTNNQVRAENSRRMHSSPFFRGAGECKFPECNAKVKFVIHKERGKYVHVTYVGNVYHKVRGSSVAKK